MFNGSSCETGVSAEPLIETGSCNPALSVWHGEEDVATFSTDAGIFSNDVPKYGLQNMFDNDLSTFYNSHGTYTGVDKTITINFQVSFTSLFARFLNASPNFLFKEQIFFHKLRIEKRDCAPWINDPWYATCTTKYLDLCLILNSENANALCTG